MDKVLRELARFDRSGDSALAIITSFQHIAERHGWDETDIVIAMSQHSGHPARIAVDGGSYLRSDVNGKVSQVSTPPHELWPAERTGPGEEDSIWLERTGPITLSEAVILHSSAQLLGELGALNAAENSVEFFDPLATLSITRDHSLAERLLKRLGIDPEAACFAIAQPGPTVGLQLSTDTILNAFESDASGHSSRFGAIRTGIGIQVEAIHFADSWDTASKALSLASEGNDFDAGATVVRYSDVALLAHLTEVEDLAENGDVKAVASLCTEISYAAKTLDGISRNSSIRSVASTLFTHHSTVQARIAILEGRLGWEVTTAAGKLRLQLALAARRVLLHGVDTRPPRSAFASAPTDEWRPKSATWPAF